MKDHIITLQDGRKLAYIEYGKTNGLPVMLFHGTPGSRIWSLTDDMVAKRLGIRLLSIDRPGYGLSDQKRNRTVLDWAEDVNELADQLKLQTFSIYQKQTSNNSGSSRVNIHVEKEEFIV
ncbi:alpha/beta hydrolase, partial [Bacillus sp. Xin]